MGSGGFGLAVTMVIFIVFIIIMAFIIPHEYNKNLKSDQTHDSYCANLNAQIKQMQTHPTLQNLTIAYVKEYSANCSS